MSLLRPALFLDRDGIINRDTGYTFLEGEFQANHYIIHLINTLLGKQIPVIVVTNQSGIGRGLYSTSEFHFIMNYFRLLLDPVNQQHLFVYFCPHLPGDNCSCRKPSPNLYLKAINEHSLDPTQSIAIGDSISDIQASSSAGITRNYLVCDPLFSKQSISAYPSDNVAYFDSLNMVAKVTLNHFLNQ